LTFISAIAAALLDGRLAGASTSPSSLRRSWSSFPDPDRSSGPRWSSEPFSLLRQVPWPLQSPVTGLTGRLTPGFTPDASTLRNSSASELRPRPSSSDDAALDQRCERLVEGLHSELRLADCICE